MTSWLRAGLGGVTLAAGVLGLGACATSAGGGGGTTAADAMASVNVRCDETMAPGSRLSDSRCKRLLPSTMRSYTARELLAAKDTVSTKALLAVFSESEPAGGPGQAQDSRSGTPGGNLAGAVGNLLNRVDLTAALDVVKVYGQQVLQYFEPAWLKPAKEWLAEHLSPPETDGWFSDLKRHGALLDSITVDLPVTEPGTPESRKVEAVGRYLAAMKLSNAVAEESSQELAQAGQRYEEAAQAHDQALKDYLADQYARKGVLYFKTPRPAKLTPNEFAVLQPLDGQPVAQATASDDWPRTAAALERSYGATPAGRKEAAELGQLHHQWSAKYRDFRKTTAGATGLLAFGIPFNQKLPKLVEQSKMHVPAAMSLLKDTGNAWTRGVKTAYAATTRQDSSIQGSFVVQSANGTPRTGLSADAALAALPSSDRPALDQAWTGSSGSHLARLHQHSRKLAAEVLERHLSDEVLTRLRSELRLPAGSKSSLESSVHTSAALGDRLYRQLYSRDAASDAPSSVWRQAQEALQSGKVGFTARELRLIAQSQPDATWIQVGRSRLRVERPGLDGLDERLLVRAKV